MNKLQTPLPAPTSDLAQAVADLRDEGVCLVRDALDAPTLERVRTALYRAADDDRQRRREVKFIMDNARDDTNQRVWNLPSRDPIFCDLVEHPLALELVRAAIGWPALLSNISANITGPGGGEMIMHADQLFAPQPWSGMHGVNIMWCVDDFRDDNGATRMVPRSHLLNRTPTGEDQSTETVALEAAAGTLVAMDGRIWHKTGNNRTASERRAGVFAFYTMPIYRTQENWFLALDPSIRQFGSDNLLVLFGYRSEGLGLVNGASPC
ncbi:MAG: hypothetical protein QOI47_1825 [Actinomycetota bacterium]|jgi:ectoine hydroxylase-related dioxygenase (phytanoyl-CoA dioxygenase family)|nr:hypothetical protein [Actinomycetota bacterium]